MLIDIKIPLCYKFFAIRRENNLCLCSSRNKFSGAKAKSDKMVNSHFSKKVNSYFHSKPQT